MLALTASSRGLSKPKQQVRIPGMKLELVDALPVADEVFDAAHGGRAEDPNDSAKSGSCEKWLSSL